MKRLVVVAAAAAMLTLSGCTSDADTDTPSAGPTTTPTRTINISNQESGPSSPIAFDISVPSGAVQLGPLIRARSAALVAAYEPDLAAAQQEQAQKEAEKQEQDASNGTPPTPTTAETTDPNKPESDSFDLLDQPPRPDIFTSHMRIDGNPTKVFRRMLAQLSVLLPDSNIVTDNLATYCTSVNTRITGCALDVTGTTPGKHQVRAQLWVDPGNVVTRTGRPGSQADPVMTLTLSYAGDPRTGQEDGFSEDLPDPPSIASPELSGLVWPRMDVEAPSTSRLVGAWTAPANTTLLLSARSPWFALLYGQRSTDIAAAATGALQTLAPGAPVTRDVISDLNEVVTVQTATTRKGSTVQAVYVVSARGTYLAVQLTPPA